MKIEEKLNLLRQGADLLRNKIGDFQFIEMESIILTHMYIEANSELADQMPKEQLWSYVTHGGGNLKDRIKNASAAVEKTFPFLKDVFNYIEIPSQIDDNSLHQLINTFQPITTLTANEFGELLKKLLHKFGINAGRRGGIFFTPLSIAILLPQLLDIKKGDVNDGAAGINQLLIETSRYAEVNGGKVKLFGQEINTKTWALGKLQLFINGLTDATVTLGDTLLNPPLTDDHVLQKFDYIVMDPPYSMKSHNYDQMKNQMLGQFNYGFPSKANTDMAFISHAVASLNENGKAAVLMSLGVLFRGGADGKIREGMIRDDLIEAVIGLPSNLLYATSIPIVILIFNKNKPKERKEKILFIDGSNEYTLGKGQNILEEKHIEKIVKMFQSGEENEENCRFVSTNEIIENDASLNISRYFSVNEVKGKFGQYKVDLEKFEKSSKQKKHLYEVAETFRGMNMPSLSKVTSMAAGYPVIQLIDVQDGEVKLDQLKMIPLEDPSKVQNYLVQEGDVIVSNRGNVTKVAVIPMIDKQIILSHNFHAIRPKEEMNALFIKTYLESPVGQSYLESLQKGTAIKVLGLKEFNYLMVPVLSADQQEEIGNEADRAEKEYREALKKATEERKKKYQDCYEKMGISAAVSKNNY